MGFGDLTWLNARAGYYNAYNVQCAKIIQCHQEDRTSLSWHGKRARKTGFCMAVRRLLLCLLL